VGTRREKVPPLQQNIKEGFNQKNDSAFTLQGRRK
jgi:hypothetical protein